MLNDNNGNKIILSKKSKRNIAIITAIVVVITFFCGFFSYKLFLGKKNNSINWAIDMIDKYGCYYDEDTGEVKKFSESDYLNMITSYLDKYSRYYTKKEYNAELQTSKGNNYGIGISFEYNKVTEDYSVYRVLWNSPAEKAGLNEGDIFIKGYANGKETVFDNENTPMDFLNGVQAEQLKITVSRNGVEKEFDIKKEVYVQNFVKYQDNEKSLYFCSDGGDKLTAKTDDNGNKSLDDKTAYISLYLFEGNVSSGIKTAMEYLKERKKTKLILDLRNNGGGFMNDLEKVASYLIKNGDEENSIVAIARDNDGDEEIFRSADNKFNDEIEKIVVLANENTASASECLIGAMEYYGYKFSKENLVIEKHVNSAGETVATTYGKGIMQTTYKNFFTGEAMKLTTATIFWPDGKTSIHNKGLTTVSVNEVDKGNGLMRALEILG